MREENSRVPNTGSRTTIVGEEGNAIGLLSLGVVVSNTLVVTGDSRGGGSALGRRRLGRGRCLCCGRCLGGGGCSNGSSSDRCGDLARVLVDPADDLTVDGGDDGVANSALLLLLLVVLLVQVLVAMTPCVGLGLGNISLR
jgi:hypothetical protein